MCCKDHGGKWGSAYNVANLDVAKCEGALSYIESAKARLLPTGRPPTWLLKNLDEAHRRVHSLVPQLRRLRDDLYRGNSWCGMNNAPLDSTPVLLWHEDWIDEDFNPSGVIDGYFSADADCGWVGATWNGCQDCWDTTEWLEPSRWKAKIGPAT